MRHQPAEGIESRPAQSISGTNRRQLGKIGNTMFIYIALLSILVVLFLFFLEVIFGSDTGTHNAEVGYPSTCRQKERLPIKFFFLHLAPFVGFTILGCYLVASLVAVR